MEQTMRIRFTRNVRYRLPGELETRSYGPDYVQDVADVPRNDALAFLQTGRAEPAELKRERLATRAARSRYPGRPRVAGAHHSDPPIEAQEPAAPEIGGALALPDDLPGRAAFEAAGVTTVGALLALDDPLAIRGVGKATARAVALYFARRPALVRAARRE